LSPGLIVSKRSCFVAVDIGVAGLGDNMQKAKQIVLPGLIIAS
jgi:hypothetical protein